MPSPTILSVVDDDESVRESLPDLLREFGFTVHAFSSAEEFLASDLADLSSCLILDIAMPGPSPQKFCNGSSTSNAHPSGNLPRPAGVASCNGSWRVAVGTFGSSSSPPMEKRACGSSC